MIKYLENFFIFLILILPITLITGPAIPDLSIFFAEIFFIFLIIYKKQFLNFTNSNIFVFLRVF